jgi:hypothetical protein
MFGLSNVPVSATVLLHYGNVPTQCDIFSLLLFNIFIFVCESCICVLGAALLLVSATFLLYHGNVPTQCDIKNEKQKISQCVGTFPWYNRKVAETSKSDAPNTQMHDSQTNMKASPTFLNS